MYMQQHICVCIYHTHTYIIYKWHIVNSNDSSGDNNDDDGNMLPL